MAKRTESNVYTIIFVVLMVVIVGALLASVANLTKNQRVSNVEVKTKIDVLSAIGVEANRTNATELFETNIKEQYIIRGTKATPDDKAYLTNMKKELAKIKEGKEADLPLFIAEKGSEKIYIVPVRGNGLWNAIWGYIALKSDLKTIDGVFFDHLGETPGLGANITQSYFTEDFKGELIYDASDTFKGVALSKSNADPKNEDKTDNEVDAIAGATITGDGVAAMIRSGLKLYLPYFETIKQ